MFPSFLEHQLAKISKHLSIKKEIHCVLDFSYIRGAVTEQGYFNNIFETNEIPIHRRRMSRRSQTRVTQKDIKKNSEYLNNKR